MWNLLVGPIINTVGGYFKDKAAIKKAKVEGEINIIQQSSQNAADWEKIHAKGSQTSWKDEFWTIVWSVPLILSFVTVGDFDGPQYAMDGFAALKQMPEWYQYTLVTMVLASFGIRIGSTVKNQLDRFKKNAP